MSEKIIGYSLLAFGLLIILWAFFNAYKIVSGDSKAPEYFSFPAISVPVNSLLLEESLKSSAPDSELAAQEIELIGDNMVNGLANTIVHFFALGLISSVGTKFSTIGVSLLRPIKVNLKKELKT